MTLRGKTALVTGGSRGIGRAIILKLAESGAKVAVHYFQKEDQAKASAGGLRRPPGQDKKVGVYGFSFSTAGFISAVLGVGALNFADDAAIIRLGCQKSADAEAISSGGLLSSGEKRKSVDSV